MTKIVGHRGGRNLWAENSLSGFRNLLALPVDAVEFDVHPTAGGELVVIHDPLLDRTAHDTGAVARLDAAARRATRLRDTLGEPVPTLDDVLDVFAASTLELHVELKNDAVGAPYPGLAAAVTGRLRDRGLATRAVVTSFVPEVLEDLRRTAPEMRRLASLNSLSAAMLGGLEAALERFAPLVDVVAIEKTLMLEGWETIGRHLPAERLCVWVPNTVDELAFWLERDVGHLTSDRPDLATMVRAARA
jgi:glycerophosphoryl diester phosphodiesterase